MSPREQAEALVLLRRWVAWAKAEPLIAAELEAAELIEASEEMLELPLPAEGEAR